MLLRTRLSFCVLRRFFDVAYTFLDLALNLLPDALDLLGRAAGRFTDLLLNLAGNVFCRTLDLIAVHAVSDLREMPASGVSTAGAPRSIGQKSIGA